MRPLTRLRASSALWTAPLALGLVWFYFSGNIIPSLDALEGRPEYAPSVTSHALSGLYAVTYAAAACLGAWEGGRLKRDGVWRLAPARARARVAAHTLLPVLLIVWAIPVLSVAAALVRESTAPTPGSMILPLLAMAVTAAHLVVGFCVGALVPRLIAAPVLAVVVFYCVAASWSYKPFWLRHISGQFPVELEFGELPTARSLLPHLLLAGGLAAGAVLLWLPRRSAAVRVALAAVGGGVILAGSLSAYATARDWSHTPPLSTGHLTLACVGQAPEVCLPEAEGVPPVEVRQEVTEVLTGLAGAGVAVDAPATITDSVAAGRAGRRSTAESWWLPLTSSHHDGTTRMTVLGQAVDFPCPRPDPEAGRNAMLWAAHVTGTQEQYLAWQRVEVQQFVDGDAQLRRTVDRVDEVRSLPAAEQTAWFEAERRRACERGAR
ncbi:hypothetical protein ACTWP5_02220 [Streptomyces sp. 4N509B]|uniref:hypothetical protein n=1 Tax=Streptomyces sp. 4N509B TaxID=3457413 RepID=UPI003FD079E1